MIRAALLLAALVGCVDTDDSCGPAPLAPGWAFAYQGETVTMSRADAAAINAWRDDVALYLECVEVRQ